MKPLFKTIALLVFCIISHNCNAQNKEQFLNSIFKVFVDSSFTQYHLISEARPIKIYNLDRSMSELTQFINEEKLNELLSNSKADSLEQTWDCNSLKLANCVSNTDDILLNLTAEVKGKWSKKKKDKEVKKQVAVQKGEYLKKKSQDRVVFSFSRPIFDENMEYALIVLHSSCGFTCGYQCLYLFQNINGAWAIVTKTDCYLS